MTFTSRTLISGSSYLPRRHGSYSSRGYGRRVSSKTCRHSASRRIGSKLARSSYRRRDTDYGLTMSTSSSSGTGYHSDPSTYSSYTTGYESYTSTDDVSSSFLSDTYDSNTSVTDESSYSIASATCDSYTSADGSSYTFSDGEYDSYGSTNESYEKANEGTTGTERKALTISLKTRKSGCLPDSHSSTDDSYYSDTGKNTESDSSEKSSSDTTSVYYSGKYNKRRHGFKRCSSGRKWRSSTKDGRATVTVSRKFRPSTYRGQPSKRRSSYCTCAGGENKKRRRF